MNSSSLVLRSKCGLLFAVAVLVSFTLRAEDKPAATPSKLTILKAEYGDLPDGGKTDVTEKIKAMVKPGENLSVEATNDNFDDPAEGVEKKLKIEYTLDDKKLEATAAENESLTVMVKPGNLLIVSAFYGDLPGGDKADVKAKVQAMVKDDALAVDASNDNFDDPAEGIEKKLKIEYTFAGGAAKTKEVNEGEQLTISNKGE